MLVYSASEAEDSTPPHTPPASHEELPETSTKGSDGATTPTSQSTSVEKLHMLTPLVTMDWDEEIDFF
ncbi:hypothetical protein PHLGIDRAFT_20507 [Phlebiopsis gigantea 11061_1 CR5-6]|uniref:Uncharacterized protein n=1 Tax=Phlebiopsis gigantea (strain 11061_1 CR5-6) TaxID=745531 RepID=A0A0C3NCE9_PHLG1|nr:hypothetical protein PHLGIDRAFT_20507 [Phlebiopsis gigantea 11061_1 CR5-6]